MSRVTFIIAIAAGILLGRVLDGACPSPCTPAYEAGKAVGKVVRAAMNAEAW
jgi:hypothetical protein